MAKPRPALCVLTVSLVVSVLAALPLAAQSVEETAVRPDRSEQRQQFQAAEAALRQRQLTRYRALLPGLEDYPLLPYLHYQDISRRLSTLPREDVNRFLAEEGDSFLGERLRRQWLQTLASRRQWQHFLSAYDPRLNGIELTCLYLQARLETGDSTALDPVAELWSVGHSQPDGCDPLFALWMKSSRFTDEVRWERHKLAISARNQGLAGYVRRLMSDEQRALAELYLSVDRNPGQLERQARFSAQSRPMQDIILNGLQRLALRDAPLALELWQRYDAQQLFDEAERGYTQHHIATRLARQGYLTEAEALLDKSPRLTSEDLIEWLIRDALSKQQWTRVTRLIGRLPESGQESERWRYWRARALEAGQMTLAEGDETPEAIYASIAANRSFYGFLSADRLGRDYHLLDRPIQVSDELLREIEFRPGIQRARELYILGDHQAMRREWFHTIGQLNQEELAASGKLAESWGWYRKSIHSMIQARHWDDLQLRFPLAYQDQVASAARDTAINPHLLFAIARQESAFSHDARSPAGALGLMQLLPSTAQYTARRNGIPYRHQHDLLQPEKNIALGSRYLHQLLNEFDGNRILAAAAYNAGPTRVKQWLQNSQQQLPYDIWIETIPFRETRGYVQNVLAFSVIYGYRTGERQPFITQAEAESRL